jgi:cation diffusion facilitator family transporter
MIAQKWRMAERCSEPEDREGAREKNRVAVTSVLAAVVLTGAKVAAGLATGSLGILSEAAHSALDLVAALVTVFAVRASAKPADRDHPYGHGKFENVSALVETLLLLATCVWIIHEAVQRLVFRPMEVRTTLAGFLVIVLSILVDVGRSRALLRVARKYQSQALEADALHFSTDIWSSCVVLFGLAMVWLARQWHLPWLAKADALAALAVAGIVIRVSFTLGRKALDDLLDAVPPLLVEKAQAAVAGVPGVERVLRIRIRRTGGTWFSDVAISVREDMSARDAHDVADAVEGIMREMFPRGDCVVHVEPEGSGPRQSR